MSNWIEERNQKVKELKEYVSQVERKLSFSVDALSSLSQGYGIKVGNESHDKAMQRLAGKN